MIPIRRIAVLGAGTMGARIAAHCANAGFPALLLDVVLPGEADRNSAARKGLEAARKGSPAGFFTDAAVSLVTAGNFEDDLPKLAGCDWIVEAVTENLEIKRALWRKVEAVRKPGSVVSTNTSGIPLRNISEGFSEDFRKHFLGTHFFNPPRYLHLLELIPGADTAADVLAGIEDFCDRLLGKGVVPCKDTPNFVANRIGSFFGSTVLKIFQEDGYTIEEVDALTGSLIGLPNSATFRLVDIIGLDVWNFVSKNLYELAPADPWRERFLPPPFLTDMIQRGWLGEKKGQGFYKRTGKGDKKEIFAIDVKTFEYHPAAKPKFPEAEDARLIDDLPGRLRVLVKGQGRASSFLWKLYSDSFLYAAERIPEIADRVVEIDNAMKWGYAHQLGPFELWDALGFKDVCERLEKEGRALPAPVIEMRRRGATGFYRPADEKRRPRTEHFDFKDLCFRPMDDRPGVVSLKNRKRAGNVIQSNAGASLVDLGDGALCVEFHSKMNALGEDQIGMIYAGLEETEKNFEAMVIANEGEHFSVGANLFLVILAAQEEEWDELNLAIQRFQQANMAIKYAARPVVAAPFGRALGGGCEIPLHCARVQASAELYMGLVETGVGLIPGAGGCKELVARLRDPRKIFELIGMAKVSGSAENAKELGLLDKAAGISMNPERLVADAKAAALALASSYRPGTPRNDIKVLGGAAFAALKQGAWLMRQAGHISDHDMTVAEKLARVITGGNITGENTVSEQYLLDLEREAFLSLCGMPKTVERMQHTLKTGKPLRN
jgi:3-hydroxyacyl-CoA dehydrogenase